MAALQLDSPIQQVKGVGNTYAAILKKAEKKSVFDLLCHFPIYYINFADATTEIQLGNKQLYVGTVVDWKLTHVYRKRLSLLRVKTQIGPHMVSVIFFNKAYLAEFFKTHQKLYLYGQLQLENGSLQVTNPVIFNMDESNRSLAEPVYARIGALTSGKIKQLVQTILSQLVEPNDHLPADILKKYDFPGITAALAAIHMPSAYDPEKIETWKRRFIYSEFLFFQLELQFVRDFFKQVPRVFRYPMTLSFKEKLQSLLPFSLTPDQECACNDIFSDLSGDFTMQRLVQGDVGSGKTIVAFIALAMVQEGGYQGAFLAPTEILATQQYHSAQRFFQQTRLALLTGATPTRERKELLKKLREGEIDIIFGTHALLTESVQFSRLTMVVIDEQHRFGVSQRAALYYKGHAVDLLVTTATPIPRTMLLSLYNDLQVSVIKTKPQGRLPVITKIRRPEERDTFYLKLKEKIAAGQKAFIILPLIEKSEYFSELLDIESQAEYFNAIFANLPIGIVTGRTPTEEKEALLERLVSGEIRLLIATTVIEVGIDVPDATIMVIENADRYGLSQLHQLRGRVGRGTRQSYCYLFPSPTLTESGKMRLKTFVESNDGFEIAETDLKMRGGGIIAGLQQSGHLDFKIANMQDHHTIFKEAQHDATFILTEPKHITPAIQEFLNGIQEKLKNINFS